MTIQDIKNRFQIIGNAPMLLRAIDIAMQVAPTDLNVLITGESGTGKEVFPQIIHLLSARKHGQYIAVNCGAIPEGTIDSELFGHEKGSFTGAHETRKGYFEVANGGTIFLDEVSEMPLATQARLLRVLETGEFLKVGSSKVQKTNVRVVAATNVNLQHSIEKGKFREDLYYRLNTVPILIPPLRERKDDIPLLFRKFASDFASKYKMPPIKLTTDAEKILMDYYWEGNVRQLKNITEQISIIEKTREISAEILQKYLPEKSAGSNLPILFKDENAEGMTERELLYKILFDMRKDLNDLKQIVFGILQGKFFSQPTDHKENVFITPTSMQLTGEIESAKKVGEKETTENVIHQHEELSETLSLEEKEKEMIIKALQKHKGRRNRAAKELGISSRTLYRKFAKYGIDPSVFKPPKPQKQKANNV
jgi:transcriptional regulator with PAS, ATPase and Fis domain